MTTEEAIRILYEMLSKTFNGGGEPGGLAVNMAVEALRKQEKPLSEDLEEAAEEYTKYHVTIFPDGSCDRGNRQIAFKAGAKWQKAIDDKAMEAADKAYFDSCEKIRQHTIINACKWLRDIYSQFDITDTNGYVVDIDTLVGKFKQAMEK